MTVVDRSGMRPEPPARKMAGSWAAVGAHHGATMAGTLAFAVLVATPLALVALSAKLRHLIVAVAAGVPLGVLAAVFAVRCAVPAVAYRRLGAERGDEGLDAIARWAHHDRDRLDRLAARFERRWWVPCALWPTAPITAALAGHHRVPARHHAAVAGTAAAVRLAAVVAAGLLLREPVLAAIGWLERYQWWALVATFLVVFTWSVVRAHREVRRDTAPEPGDGQPGDAAAEEVASGTVAAGAAGPGAPGV